MALSIKLERPTPISWIKILKLTRHSFIKEVFEGSVEFQSFKIQCYRLLLSQLRLIG